jgi:MFS transporter, DHA1 family, multidrug resistance protein
VIQRVIHDHTPKISTPLLATLLAALSMLGPFSIDTFFPSFPTLAHEFSLTDFALQQTLTAYMLPYALTSLLPGALSDALGRKPIILGGLILYVMASVGCLASTSFSLLLTFRALQGAVAGVGSIVGRALLRDMVEGASAQRMMSLVTTIFSIAPAIAPIIGGYLELYFGWHGSFAFMSLFGALLLLVCWLWLPESHPPARRVEFSAVSLLRECRTIVRDPLFLLLGFSGALNFAALFLYISSAPKVVLTMWHLNQQQFGWFFVPVILGMTTGAMLSGKLAGKVSSEKQKIVGFGLTLGAGGANIIYNSLVHTPHHLLAVIPLIAVSAGVSLVFPLLVLQMLDRFARVRGSASSVQSLIALLVMTIVGGVLSTWAQQNALRLSLTSAALGLTAFVLWLFARRMAMREANSII